MKRYTTEVVVDELRALSPNDEVKSAALNAAGIAGRPVDFGQMPSFGW